MAYNTVENILSIGRLSLDDLPESEIETAILEAETEIDLRIPPLVIGDKGYDRYQRRLPLITQAHGFLSLSYVYKRMPYDTLAHAEPGDPLGILHMNYGAKTPEINTIADYFRKLSDDYRKQAEDLLKKCLVRVPTIRRPAAIEL